MTEKEIRLIGLDLDGTTLTTDKKLTPRTKAVLEECIRQGITVLAATGRVKTGIPDYLKNIDGMRYVITSNGASIVDLEKDEVIYQNGIPWERALELFDILEGYDTYYDAYLIGDGWCEGRFYDHLEDYNIKSHIKDLVLTTRQRIDDLPAFVREHKQPVEKISMFFASQEKRQQVYEELSKIEDIAATYSLSNNIEINYHTCDKGEALLSLARILGIDEEGTMGCGDGINDLAMIEKAGIGVAMANGEEILKERADFITKTNDEEGVAWAIEKFCKIIV
ncbi:MAG: Cof-type HAD-IIB family hydrolase [Eubacteriales bacterium]|nr:Cof-type HAD-IIB family hydrolase [Eubacteriales bacterium]